MSEESQQANSEEKSSSDKNWEALEADRDRWRAEAETNRPFKLREDVRQAGLDPDSPQGRIAVKDLAAGSLEVAEGADFKSTLIDHLANEYGFDKPKTELTESEQAQVSASERFERASQATFSADPDISEEDQIQALYAQADEATDPAVRAQLLNRARQAKNAVHARQMLAQSG